MLHFDIFCWANTFDQAFKKNSFIPFSLSYLLSHWCHQYGVPCFTAEILMRELAECCLVIPPMKWSYVNTRGKVVKSMGSLRKIWTDLNRMNHFNSTEEIRIIHIKNTYICVKVKYGTISEHQTRNVRNSCAYLQSTCTVY